MGFTLMELLLAFALGAVLVVGLAHTSQQVATQTAIASQDNSADLARAVHTITESVRDSWVVETPATGRLEATDALGAETAFFLQSGSLMVRRPSGETGSLLDGVSSLTFGADTTSRLRDTIPLDQAGVTLFSDTTNHSAITLASGDRLALAFTVPVEAPSSVSTVSGVQEQVLGGSLETIRLDLAMIVGGVLNVMQGWLDPEDAYPPVWNHIKWDGNDYYDLVGFQGITSGGSCGGDIVVEVYETRVPGDPRPYGAPLGSVTLSSDAVATGFSWMGINKDNGDDGPGDGFWVEIERGKHDIDGDDDVWVQRADVVEYGWKDKGVNPYDEDYVVVASLPASAPVTLDLSGLGITLEPGRGYAVVVQMNGDDELIVRGGDLGSTSGSSVAVESDGSFSTLAKSAWRELTGTLSYSQTIERPSIERVTVTISLDNGRSMTSSAMLLSQTSAPNPWLGAAPTMSSGVAFDKDLPTLSTSAHYKRPPSQSGASEGTGLGGGQ